MARVSRPDEEQQKLAGEVAAQAPEGAAQDDTAAAQGVAPRRSKFQDISRLLYANQGQGKRVAQRAIAGADSLANAAQQQISGARTAYTQAAQAGTPAGFSTTSAPPVVQGGTLANPSTTTTLNYNVAPNISRLETAANATYQGPNSLAETNGVNLANIYGAVDRAGQAYNTLDRNPSGNSGGVGKFDDFLAGQEAGGDLRKARARFQGLRDSLGQAVKDTSASDEARRLTGESAARAKEALGAEHTRATADEAARVQAENDAANARGDDDSAYSNWLQLANSAPGMASVDGFSVYNPFNGTINGLTPRQYYEQNRDKIKERLRSDYARRVGSTYGINGNELLNASGYTADGVRK